MLNRLTEQLLHKVSQKVSVGSAPVVVQPTWSSPPNKCRRSVGSKLMICILFLLISQRHSVRWTVMASGMYWRSWMSWEVCQCGEITHGGMEVWVLDQGSFSFKPSVYPNGIKQGCILAPCWSKTYFRIQKTLESTWNTELMVESLLMTVPS